MAHLQLSVWEISCNFLKWKLFAFQKLFDISNPCIHCGICLIFLKVVLSWFNHADDVCSGSYNII
jgi:hypothetical protein